MRLDYLDITAMWVLTTTLKASLLVGFILLFQLFFSKKLPARWNYALWFLLLARLALPYELSSNFSIYNFIDLNRQTNLTLGSSISMNEPKVVPSATLTVPKKIPVQSQLTRLPSAKILNEPRQQQGSNFPVFGAIWLAGVVILAGSIITGNLKLRRQIRRRKQITDPALLAQFQQTKLKMGISGNVSLIEVQNINVPLLYGFFQPKILIPAKMRPPLSHQELEHIFLHELAHLKQRDILIAWLTSVLQIINWFNPIIWFAFLRMRIDRELACDALVLSKVGAEKATNYGQTLISLVERLTKEYRLPIAVGILESKTDIKRRLIRIAQFREYSRGWSLVGIMLLSFLAVFSLTGAKKKHKEKPYAQEIVISFELDQQIKVNGVSTLIDSLSEKLNRYRFDESSLITLAPVSNSGLNNWFKVQIQLQSVPVQKIKYINAETGKSLITSQYDFKRLFGYEMMKWDFPNPVKIDGKYGYRNRDGTLVIEPQYEQAWPFDNGLAGVRYRNKWGYINKAGKFAVKPIFDDTHGFHEGMAEVKLDGKWGFIDSTGKIMIEPQYKQISFFNEGYAIVQLEVGKTCVIDRTGKTVIQPKYDRIRSFQEDLAAAQLHGRWGYIDYKGDEVIGFNFEQAGSFVDGLALVRVKGKFGFIDRTGRFVIPPQYDEADDFSEGLAAVRMENQRYGFIDRTGAVVIEPKYDFANRFRMGAAMVIIFENPDLNQKGQGFSIDKAGNVLVSQSKT